MKVLITGGSGLVGTRLTQLLTDKGAEVVWLSRKAGIKNGIICYAWDYKKGTIDSRVFEGVTHIIHLAGAGVFDKAWSNSYRKEIEESRIETTRLLFKNVDLIKNLSAFICSSAIGWYGNTLEDKEKFETDPSATDFLATITQKWEQTADLFQDKGIRTVKIRIGIVLSDQGGAFPSMLVPVKLGFGSPIASGKQVISWIHIDDLCEIFIKALEDETMKGVFNAVAPNPVDNKEFMKLSASVLKKTFFMPNVPGIILRIILGNEKSMSVIKGIRVSSEKIQKQGYSFRFPDLKSALEDLIK